MAVYVRCVGRSGVIKWFGLWGIFGSMILSGFLCGMIEPDPRVFPLHQAALRGDLDLFIACLLKRPELSINQLDHLGRTPLHCAVMSGSVSLVRFILADVPCVFGQHVNTEQVDGRGRRAFEYADDALEQFIEAVKKNLVCEHVCEVPRPVVPVPHTLNASRSKRDFQPCSVIIHMPEQIQENLRPPPARYGSIVLQDRRNASLYRMAVRMPEAREQRQNQPVCTRTVKEILCCCSAIVAVSALLLVAAFLAKN